MEAKSNLELTMSQAAAISRATNLFMRFKARELSRLPGTSNNQSQLPTQRNPFLPSKSASSKFTIASKYSLRRQKELLKAARLLTQTGRIPDAEDFLPVGPKALERVNGGGINKALEALGRSQSTVSISKAPVGSSQQFGKAHSQIEWTGIPRPRKTHGMYEGRRVAFKFHKWERNRRSRRAAIKKQVQGMGQRVEEWRNRRAGKTAGSKLPF